MSNDYYSIGFDIAVHCELCELEDKRVRATHVFTKDLGYGCGCCLDTVLVCVKCGEEQMSVYGSDSMKSQFPKLELKLEEIGDLVVKRQAPR